MIEQPKTAASRDGDVLDMRVSAPGLGNLQPFTPAVPAVEIAVDMMSRYETRPLPYPAAAFVLRNDRPLYFINTQSRNTHVQLAPRLALSLATRLIRRTERVEAGSSQKQPPEVGSLIGQLVPLPNSQPAMPELGAFFSPIPKEVRRPAPRQSHNGAGQTTRPPNGTTGDGQRMPPPAAAQAPLDVNRLTDQVIQNIDRRIVAQRERLGKV